MQHRVGGQAARSGPEHRHPTPGHVGQIGQALSIRRPLRVVTVPIEGRPGGNALFHVHDPDVPAVVGAEVDGDPTPIGGEVRCVEVAALGADRSRASLPIHEDQ